jgi:hypothetical protein
MARITILTPDVIQQRDQKSSGTGRSGRRRSPERLRLIEEYRQILSETAPGYGADVALEEGDDKRIVRQNLAAAAEDLGIALDFRPIKDKTRIHLRVITPEQKAARPKRGGGRPRKNPLPDAGGSEGQAEKPQRRGTRAS